MDSSRMSQLWELVGSHKWCKTALSDNRWEGMSGGSCQPEQHHHQRHLVRKHLHNVTFAQIYHLHNFTNSSQAFAQRAIMYIPILSSFSRSILIPCLAWNIWPRPRLKTGHWAGIGRKIFEKSFLSQVQFVPLFKRVGNEISKTILI